MLIILAIVFTAMQFIRPSRNTSGQVLPTDIANIFPVPANVSTILKNACNDCHSNNTHYRWYVNIQPVGWMMASHIKNGKQNLNFSEFGTYSSRKQANKLRAIENSLTDGTMPLPAYLIMHKDAALNAGDKKLLNNWASTIRDSLMRR